MRALSIRQPWAELILLRRKRYELRNWSTRWRGRFLIHASGRGEPYAMAAVGLPPEELAMASIVGSVELVSCTPFTRAMADEMRLLGAYFDNWQSGLIAWELREPIRLPTPIPWRGALGLFEIPDDILPN